MQPLTSRALTMLSGAMYSSPVFMSADSAKIAARQNPRGSTGEEHRPPFALLAAEIVLLSGVIAGVLDSLRFAAYYIPLRFALHYEEGNILNAALRITRGHTPYPPVGGLPYVVNPYGPVFYYLVAPLVKWFGLSFTAPRVLVLLSGLAVGLLLVLLLRHWTRSWLVALGFGLSFLAVTPVREWLYMLRVEMFGLALVLAGLYLFATRKSLLWSALLFLAALFTKITFLAAPVAVILYLLLSGDRRRALRFVGWMLLFGVAGLVALGAGTDGWALFHMFLTHPDPYHLDWYFARLWSVGRWDLGLAAGAILLAVRDLRRRSVSLPLIFCALATLMTIPVGKLGADLNELLEWQAALCLAAGCGYAAVRNRLRPDSVVALIPIALLATVLLGLSESRRLSPAISGCPAAYQFAAEQPGQLLTENSGAAVLSGKTVWLSNSFEYCFLGKAGRLDEEPLIRLVRQKFFGLIMMSGTPRLLASSKPEPGLHSTLWPPQFIEALTRNYHQVARFSCGYAEVAYEPDAPPAR